MKIVVTKSQVVVLILVVLTGFVLRWYMRSEGIVVDDPSRTVSLHGVVLKIPDREAMVLPSTYLTPGERREKIPKIKSFTLCVRLPDFTLHSDIESRQKCLAVGKQPSNMAVFAIDDNGSILPPAPVNADFLSRRLKRLLTRQDNNPRGWKGYVAGEDLHGLHIYIPTENLEKSTKTIFWQGANIDHVSTFIGCEGYLKKQNFTYKKCVHEFSMPTEEFDGGLITITLYYRQEWLLEWRDIETNAAKMIRSIRLNQASTNRKE